MPRSFKLYHILFSKLINSRSDDKLFTPLKKGLKLQSEGGVYIFIYINTMTGKMREKVNIITIRWWQPRRDYKVYYSLTMCSFSQVHNNWTLVLSSMDWMAYMVLLHYCNPFHQDLMRNDKFLQILQLCS